MTGSRTERARGRLDRRGGGDRPGRDRGRRRGDGGRHLSRPTREWTWSAACAASPSACRGWNPNTCWCWSTASGPRGGWAAASTCPGSPSTRSSASRSSRGPGRRSTARTRWRGSSTSSPGGRASGWRPAVTCRAARWGCSTPATRLGAAPGGASRCWPSPATTGGRAWDLSPGTPDTTGQRLSHAPTLTLTGAWRRRDALPPGRQDGIPAPRPDRRGRQRDRGAIFDRETLSEQASATVEPDWRFAGGSRLRLTGHYGLLRRSVPLRSARRQPRSTSCRRRASTWRGLGAQHDWRRGQRPPAHLGRGGAVRADVLAPAARRARGRAPAGRCSRSTSGGCSTSPRLALLPGVRLDADSQFGAHASPKIAVRYDPHETVALRAAYGWGYRAPSFQELYLLFENPGGRLPGRRQPGAAARAAPPASTWTSSGGRSTRAAPGAGRCSAATSRTSSSPG